MTRPASVIAPDMFGPPAGAWPFGALEPQAYGLIMADPPWSFALHSEAGEAKSPQAQYACMTTEAIAALPVADLARADCLLWLWCTAPMIDQQLAVLRAWGFRFVSMGAWDKGRWGTGYVWRSVAEFVALGKRGEPQVDGRGVPNLIRGGWDGHSRKPDAAYAMAERMLPRARRASLFERPLRPGWEGWGDQYGLPASQYGARRGRGGHGKAPGKEQPAAPALLQAMGGEA